MWNRGRLPPRLVVGLALALGGFALVAGAPPARAQVDLEFSDSFKDAIRDAKIGDPDRVEQRLERRINQSLEEHAKTNPDAKALYESGQTLRIVCFGDAEATAAGLTQDFDLTLGGNEAGETRGDFDQTGKPRAKGKAIIAIDCDRLRAKGLEQPALPDGSTMYAVLLHELLHAANQARRHPPDALDIYEKWAQDLQNAFLRARGVRTPETAPPPGPGATPSPPPPGAPAGRETGAVVPPGQSFYVQGGPLIHGTGVPAVQAGTVFNATLGRELRIVLSPERFTGSGFDLRFGTEPAEDERPNGMPTTDWRWLAKIRYFNFSGSTDATIPIGAANVAHTYLAPNPQTGVTGVSLLATGSSVGIETRGHQVDVQAVAIYGRPLGTLAGFEAYGGFGGGLHFNWRRDSHHITQQSLTFPDIFMRTTLRNEEYFFGPKALAIVGAERGKLYVGASVEISIGPQVINGVADQDSRCNLCPPGDQDFSQRHDFSTTKFGLKFGLRVWADYEIVPSLNVGVSFDYRLNSRTGSVFNPTTPADQPARQRSGGSSDQFIGAIYVKYRF